MNAKPRGQQLNQVEVQERHAVVAVDLGNSAAKWAIDDQAERRISLRFPDWSERLIEEVGGAVGNRTASWRIASVNRPITKQLIGRLKEISPDCDVKTISFDDIPMIVCVANPDRVGIDRLLAAWMCTKLYPNTSSIVVDAGSAITVDVVSKDAEFLGGAILPGLALQFDSLARGTDALPAIDLVADAEQEITADLLPMPATDTISAIRSGILLGVAAAIDGLIQYRLNRSQSDHDNASHTQIVFTGGDAALLSRLTRHSHSLAPRLVLDAIGAIDRERMLNRTTQNI